MWLVSTAMAGTLGPGLYLPGATSIEHSYVGVRGGYGATWTPENAAPAFGADLATGDGRWAFGASGIGGGFWIVDAGGRWLAIDERAVRVAVIGTIGLSLSMQWEAGDYGHSWIGCACAGGAVEVGGGPVRLDLATGLLGLSQLGVRPDRVVLSTFEAGLSVLPARGHRLRVGFASLLPTASYRLELGHVYGEVAVAPPVTWPNIFEGTLHGYSFVSGTLGARW